MAQQLRAECHVLDIWEGKKGKSIQLMIRKNQRDGFKPEVKVVLLGDSESGKSTLLGVLTSGKLDNGSGLARLSILNHKHEVLSGVTSSETYSMLGFDADGNVTNNQKFGNSSERIFDSSTKIVSFFDSGGHQKYSRSLIQSLITNCPDYAMITINPLGPNSNSFRKNFQMACVLQIPMFIVFTHLDMIDKEELMSRYDEIKKIKREVDSKMNLVLVRTPEDVVLLGKNIKENLIPVFAVNTLNKGV